MPHCLVIADDLTGANATGVLLKKAGFHALTAVDRAGLRADTAPACDCLIVPTDSRAIDAQAAYDRVAACLRALGRDEIRLYAKRIDSTLRGNLGRETDAFLDVLGEDYIAVCVPVFPASGRVLVGSHLLVNGVPLGQTEAAKDPKCPVHASHAGRILQMQTDRKVALITLDEVQSGVDALAEEMRRRRAAGARILLVDSVTMQDIEIVADALVKTGMKVVSVDPGPFTALMAARLLPPQTASGKVFCAIGSVNGVAAQQTLRLLRDMPVAAVTMDARALIESEASRAQELERVLQALCACNADASVVAVVGSGIDPAQRLNLLEYGEKLRKTPEALSEIINEAFAEITLTVFRRDPSLRALYSTGGDISAAIHRRAGTQALRLEEEVVPLAAFGQIIGGALDGLHCISKGGMVGDENAMITCVKYLQAHMQ